MSDDSEELAYEYTIPLEEVDGVEQPSYEPTLEGEVLKKHYNTSSYILVQTEAVPHYHMDSVDVIVEEVPKEDYK